MTNTLQKEIQRIAEATGEPLRRIEISYRYDDDDEVWFWTARVFYTLKKKRDRTGEVEDWGGTADEAARNVIVGYARVVEAGLAVDARD